jgi:hypothetical protein
LVQQGLVGIPQVYVSPVFELQAYPEQAKAEAQAEAGNNEGPHPDPDRHIELGFQYSTAINFFSTEYEYATKNQKAVEYAGFAAEVFKQYRREYPGEHQGEQQRQGSASGTDQFGRWFYHMCIHDTIIKRLNKFTSEEDIRKMVQQGFEVAMNDKI